MTYTEEDGSYMPEEPTELFEVGDITVDVKEDAEAEATTELSFLDAEINDPDLVTYAVDPRSSTLVVGNPSAVDLSFEHANETGLVPGEPQRYELVVTGAEDGIAGYDMEVAIDDDDIATFVEVSETAPSDGESGIEEGGTVLNLEGQLDEPLGPADEIVVADVWVEAESDAFPGEGTTTVDDWELTTVEASVADSQSLPYRQGDLGIATQTVGWFDLDEQGNGPARDVTGDGLLDDVFGDDEVQLADALLLFSNRFELDTEPAFVPFFDFDGDNDVTLGDALVLFNERFERDP